MENIAMRNDWRNLVIQVEHEITCEIAIHISAASAADATSSGIRACWNC